MSVASGDQVRHPAEVFAGFGACGWATLVVADEPDNATTAADAAAIAA
jgi:hypothetical protein